MPTFPVRNLGGTGIVTDVNPFDIESPSAFTAGVNVRFRNGKVSRGPVARSVASLTFEPGHCLAVPKASSGYDQIFLAERDFKTISRLATDGSTEDVSPTAALSGLGGGRPITSCFLGGVSYLNCASDAPLCLTPTASVYSTIPAWPPTYRAQVLRAFKDNVLALGVYKGADFYPTMVKWSDLTGFGSAPTDWDPASTTNSAGENIVNEMQHAIVDGLALRNAFVLYCTNSVWQMDYVGGSLIYDFTKLFDDRGIINVHCAVQVGGTHFVFDRNDIYVHDGGTPRSIADTRTRDFIFSALDASRTDLCFVSHDERMSEIRFCYPSSDDLVGWHNPSTGCNRAAVYSYANNTWTFDDLPNVKASCRAALPDSEPWDDPLGATWDTTQGLFSTSDGDANQHTFLIAQSDPTLGLTVPRLYGYEVLTGGGMTYPIAEDVIKPAMIQRTGLDLDSSGKNLTQYAHLQAIWPQAFVDNAADSYWQFGATDLAYVEPVWGDEVAFDPSSESKIDIKEAGKYLSWRFGCRGLGDFKLSGFDVQLAVRGRR